MKPLSLSIDTQAPGALTPGTPTPDTSTPTAPAPGTPTLVDLPGQNIIFRKGPKETRYVYYTVRAYRNAKGAPTSETVLIGKEDPSTGRLLPNARYYEIFGDPADHQRLLPRAARNQAFGPNYLLEVLTERNHLDTCLQKAFGEDWQLLLTCAACAAFEGILQLIDDTGDIYEFRGSLKHILFPYRAQMHKLLTSLTNERQMEFFTCWAQQRDEDAYACFNASYPETDVWMFLGRDTGMPLFYNRFPLRKGHRQASLSSVMKNSHKFGIKEIGYTFNREFVTSENLKCINRQTPRFVAPLSSELNQSARICLPDFRQEVCTPAHWLAEEDAYGARRPITIAGIDLFLHTYFSSADYALAERAAFARGLSAAELEQVLKIAGWSAYISNDPELQTWFIPILYRKRHLLEDVFAQVQRISVFSRIDQQNRALRDGRLFICFLATYLRCMLLNKKQAQEGIRKVNWRQMLEQIRTLPFTAPSTPSGPASAAPPCTPAPQINYAALTEAQRDILATLDLL
ncbi:MAG: hypothetical protein FWF45_02370 [Coriobacteriia bacterium]|nr:hypothetical protein [Coriobacteriia bacterium]